MRYFLTSVLLIAICGLIMPLYAVADVPYQTYYKDNYSQLFRTQAAYSPAEALGREIYIPNPNEPGQWIYSPLNQPQDLFIDQHDQLYIADTGNNRIVHLDEEGNLVRILTLEESPFNRPQGLFIDRAGFIYVADTANHRIVVLNADGEYVKEFGQPTSKLIPDSFKYDPIKLVVDKRGFIYVATLGGYQGLLQLDPDGSFQGFFGANKTNFSMIDTFKRLVYTREMYEREISKLPGSIASVDIGNDGFIYTVTKEVKTAQLKKLNIGGLDQLAGKGEFSENQGDSRYGEYIHGRLGAALPQLHDLTVDQYGNITVIDSKLNIVSQYDMNGNLLFFWGAETGDITTKLGVVKVPSAIETNSSNELFILDSENNLIQSYRLSEFGALVHEANRLTQDGRYEDSEPLWQEVYRQHAYYSPAILGVAKAAYKKSEYDLAQRLFKEAGWAHGYSDSFWQNRLIWFQNNFGVLMNVIVIVFVFMFIFQKVAMRRGWTTNWTQRLKPQRQLTEQLRHVFYVLKHPIDGFHAIRYEGKGGLLSSLIIWLLAFMSYAIMHAGTSFIFNPSIIVDVNLFNVLLQFVAIWLGFVIANYLICSLYQGEGRFRDVLYGSSYALFPFVLLGLPLTLISNVMTLNEWAIYHFLEYAIYGWVALLVFWKIQGIQNYSVGETTISLTLTAVTMAICAVLLFITFSLTSELTSFVYSVYQEVTIR